MGLGEKIGSAFGLEFVSDDDENDVEVEEKETRKQRREAAKEREAEAARPAPAPVAAQPAPSNKAKVILVEPVKFTDARKVCRELKDGNVVVVNMEKLSEADSLRVYDVIQGAAFVLEGTIEDISDNVTVVAPHNVDIQTNEAVTREPAEPDGDYGFNA